MTRTLGQWRWSHNRPIGISQSALQFVRQSVSVGLQLWHQSSAEADLCTVQSVQAVHTYTHSFTCLLRVGVVSSLADKFFGNRVQSINIFNNNTS